MSRLSLFRFPAQLLLMCLLVSALAACVAAAPTERLVDVTQYGAVGDGSTDCSAAVAKAVGVLLAGKGDGSLYFPRGTYELTHSEIYLTPQTHSPNAVYTVRGDGVDVSTLAMPYDTRIWLHSQNSTSPARGVFRDFTLTISGGGDGEDYTGCIYLTNAVDSKIENIQVMQQLASNGIHVESSSRVSLINVSVSGGIQYNVRLEGGSDLTVQCSTFPLHVVTRQQPTSVDVVGSTGVQLLNNTFSDSSRGVVIRPLTDAYGHAIPSAVNHVVAVFGSSFVAGTSIELTDNVTLTVSGNTFHEDSSIGVSIQYDILPLSASTASLIVDSNEFIVGKISMPVLCLAGSLTFINNLVRDARLGPVFDVAAVPFMSASEPLLIVSGNTFHNISQLSFEVNSSTVANAPAIISNNICTDAKPFRFDSTVHQTNNTGCIANASAHKKRQHIRAHRQHRITLKH